MKKKASVSGTLLSDRSPEQKTQIMAEVARLVVLESGRIRPVTERVHALSDVAAAHAYFETKGHVGKIVLDRRHPGQTHSHGPPAQRFDQQPPLDPAS